MPKGKAIMVQGTSSGAGKSFLATALCRYYARQGVKVAPFKAQNMSNNARVVAGGEMGSAQYFQALAAGVTPEVRMNPVLLKPEADQKSQVILLGQPHPELSRLPWRERKARLWPVVRQALHELLNEYDLLVIEGAGSPAEINLKSSDIANMRVALEAEARVLLVTDIDRGGAFAHLYGTHLLLEETERALIKGFVLNKFRGDVRLLAPGPEQLQTLTGVPTVAVLPMWHGHGLPEEDGVFDARTVGRGFRVAIVIYPRISNLDEFEPLKHLPNVELSWARKPQDLDGADLIVLPGSKHTVSDLEWLRREGFETPIRRHIEQGKPLLGICGGLQMLGQAIHDPLGIESAGLHRGLGALPLHNIFTSKKVQRPSSLELSDLKGFWKALEGLKIAGYEIHHGQSERLVAQEGSVLGLYLHGLFENPEVLQRLFGVLPNTGDVFNQLADFVGQHFEKGSLEGLVS
ncbi:cobyric acid synthase [Meiothermus granaticius]|uniref:Cobyric acid synthase n=1 Tax=Meiothermus granaticius NBRC 107808 TaxID=1227551 RepID=A0A399F6I6_9DEIN|nr:cobyric acid synthase [Meiothermus granaticius]RIH91710.1 Cobyric acid synthase [Meiothermus granaticius NBRC 107808]GEM88549.1 cobyric acid synthase [Meiothermus granaticius NBRC 107808]